jgi:hypothetical protein
MGTDTVRAHGFALVATCLFLSFVWLTLQPCEFQLNTGEFLHPKSHAGI